MFCIGPYEIIGVGLFVCCAAADPWLSDCPWHTSAYVRCDSANTSRLNTRTPLEPPTPYHALRDTLLDLNCKAWGRRMSSPHLKHPFVRTLDRPPAHVLPN